jgi:hypothetical protein
MTHEPFKAQLRVESAKAITAALCDHDYPCPQCGYNLRGAPKPQCPECHTELTLSLEPQPTVPLFWFLATVVPGFFSGICAVLVTMPMLYFGVPRGPDRWVMLLPAGGYASAVIAFLFSRYRNAFLAQPLRRQMFAAAVAWFIHVSAFTVLMVAVL